MSNESTGYNTFNTIECSTTGGYINNSYCTESVTNIVSTNLDKIIEEHCEPDVRVDQRSKLDISDDNVWAKYYENGFFKDKKIIIPEIKSVEVFHNKTVKITFKNSDIQTATVIGEDKFSLENGILWCIAKEMIGKEGSAILNKVLSYAIKLYYNSLVEEVNKSQIEKKAAELKAKKDKKFQKYIEKKKAKQKEERISELTEAIIRANKEINCDKTLKKGSTRCILHS